LFSEAIIFIVKHDNETAIKLYFFYLANIISNHKILTDKRLMALVVKKDIEEAKKLLKIEYPIVPKLFKFNLSLTEKLFKTDEQFVNFGLIFKEYLNNKNIDDVITKIPTIYRKKIKLNDESVLGIKQQHIETVGLLDKYLGEETDDENTQINPEIKIEQIPEEIHENDIKFSQIQKDTLVFFVNNNFSIQQGEFETFTKSKGIFRNQLIDSINEICYEHLDDNLIEDDDESYTINRDYYQKILERLAE
jgi:hypothetical protein